MLRNSSFFEVTSSNNMRLPLPVVKPKSKASPTAPQMEFVKPAGADVQATTKSILDEFLSAVQKEVAASFLFIPCIINSSDPLSHDFKAFVLPCRIAVLVYFYLLTAMSF